MQGFLTPEQRAELLYELKVERHAKYSDRIKTILLLDQGITYQSIALHLFLDEGTIGNYRKRYVEGGILGLVTDIYSGKAVPDKTSKEAQELFILEYACMNFFRYIRKYRNELATDLGHLINGKLCTLYATFLLGIMHSK